MPPFKQRDNHGDSDWMLLLITILCIMVSDIYLFRRRDLCYVNNYTHAISIPLELCFYEISKFTSCSIN